MSIREFFLALAMTLVVLAFVTASAYWICAVLSDPVDAHIAMIGVAAVIAAVLVFSAEKAADLFL